MSTYLTAVDGYPVPSGGTPRSKESVIYLGGKPWYLTRIKNNLPKGDSRYVDIIGYTPATFSLSLGASWDAPFGGTSIAEMAGDKIPGAQALSTAIDGATKFMGATTRARVMTAQVWSEPEYLEVTMPLALKAYSDTEKEVLENLRQMLKTAAPYNAEGILLAPGPSPKDLTFGDEDMKGAFTVTIGSWFRMEPAVIRSVSAEVEGKVEDGTGNPIAAEVTVSLSSYFAVTQQDIDRWIIKK